jgi:EcsC protein family
MDEQNRPARLQAVDGIVERLLRSGIDGIGPLAGASALAADARAATPTEADAVDRIVRNHVRLAAAEGFLTGLGGFVTMIVALPANVWAFHLLATRMVATIAAIHGHDVSRDEVRAAVLLTLAGDDAGDILRRAGAVAGQGKLTSLALRGLPPSALMAVNKGIVFRLLVRFSRSGLARFGKLVPGIGGVIGGGIDAYLMRQIGQRARADFGRSAGEALRGRDMVTHRQRAGGIA